jgi:hypothetical protein
MNAGAPQDIFNDRNGNNEPIIVYPIYMMVPYPRRVNYFFFSRHFHLKSTIFMFQFGEFREYFEVVVSGLHPIWYAIDPDILWGSLLVQVR